MNDTQKNRTVRQKGYYKLINGDCLEVMKQIPDKSIDMILCDPPYGTRFGTMAGKRPSHKKTIISEYTNYPFDVLQFDCVTKAIHPTQKPVSLLEYLIKTYSNEKEIVLDNCMGSGSTGVACINTNRKFVGIELNEHYFNVSCDRIKQAYQEKQDYGEW